jgi:hypothetical protein
MASEKNIWVLVLILVIGLCPIILYTLHRSSQSDPVLWHYGRCSNICPVGNADRYEDSGGDKDYNCTCIHAWGYDKVVYSCNSTGPGYDCKLLTKSYDNPLNNVERYRIYGI